MSQSRDNNSIDEQKPAHNQENQKRDNAIIVKNTIPKHRQDLLKWNGWGYKDSLFVVDGDCILFTGSRYPAITNLRFPHVQTYLRRHFGTDLQQQRTSQPPPSEDQLPPSRISPEHLQRLQQLQVSYSLRGADRAFRAHGQTIYEIFTARHSQFERIPDVVVWPASHEEVVRVVEFANAENLVVLAFGGGTTVSGSVECPRDEVRTIISLDTSQMNRILWVDRENYLACCESGIIGQDLERELRKLGFTSGHEPDSYEFSSLGGWVATRASGMKKNTYGNIEDLLVHVKMVTGWGVLEKNCQVPRMSCGPDFNHVIMGSEGSLGVVTEAVIKIRPLPKCSKFGSIVFPDFESGVKSLREIAKARCQPSSMRLMDNGQMQFGMIMRPEESYFGLVLDGIKKFYVTKIKGFDFEKMCIMTLLFEGDEGDVKEQERKIYAIGGAFGGMPGGQTNGERGYMFTFVIAYIRDLALELDIVAESFETSVPWDRATVMVENVKRVMAEECRKEGVKHYILNCRVTQTYDAGCVVYFYLGFRFTGLADPVGMHHYLEEKARDEIVACGGSISHHHGVGKIRKKWYESTVSPVGLDLYVATKKELDPKNIFATNNLIPKSKL